MKLQRVGHIRSYVLENKVKAGLLVLAGIWVIITVAQFIYPWNNLPLNASVQGVDIGGQSVQEATKVLNEKHATMPIQLYFGESEEPYGQPTPVDIGMTIDNANVAEANQYHWWQRLLPFSVFWAGVLGSNDVTPTYKSDKEKVESYIQNEFGKTCKVESQNATVEYKDKNLIVVPAVNGGTCKYDEVRRLLTDLRPSLQKASIRIAIDAKPAVITDKEAAEFASNIQSRTAAGLTVAVEGNVVSVDQQTLLSWLDFSSPDSGLVAKVSQERSKKFFEKQIAPKVAKPSGTSYVTTLDFTIIAQQTGPSGKTLNRQATIQMIEDWLAGSQDVVSAQVSTVAPTVVYTRKYSSTDTGITALITQYAESHAGVFGVSFIELDGNKRRAAYQDTKLFRTASTYKLFVAYSTLLRVDQGKWKWSDQIHGGRNLAKCFDDMIVLSDNPCAEALLEKIGFQAITNEIRAIGLTRSSFLNKYIETTAGDLTTFVGALQSKQLPISAASRNTLLSAMERNVHRQGIPAGAKGTVADKVGFLEDYLNDAAIVYSPSGTYVLTIMTKGSSWSAIADLTRQIEALRTK